MKKYYKDIIILIIQLFMYYIFPLFAGPTDVIGMVLLIILTTFFLSICVALLIKQKYKYLYPFVISVLFIPTVFIYYNSSALVHAIWYLVVSIVGLGIGILIKLVLKKVYIGVKK